MAVVVGLLNLMLLLLVELVSRQNCHLLLEVIVQHLLRALFAGRLLLLHLLALVVVLLVLIVCLPPFYEIMSRPYLALSSSILPLLKFAIHPPLSIVSKIISTKYSLYVLALPLPLCFNSSCISLSSGT